ncbi:MAG: type II toxin-antitoxin system VapC family toxin [Gemmatimonadetes bacterium]|nr:type II toxin-antitoxin system VapC family toxin [Gemmatimonadota bacterium]
MSAAEVTGSAAPRVLVVDASTGLKLILPEPGSELVAGRIEREARDGTTLLVPDLFWIEAANALWKRTRRRGRERLSTFEAEERLTHLLHSPFRTESLRPLAAVALLIALDTGLTAYDGAYLALAEQRDTVMLTADRRLAEQIAGTVWARRIEAVG